VTTMDSSRLQRVARSAYVYKYQLAPQHLLGRQILNRRSDLRLINTRKSDKNSLPRRLVGLHDSNPSSPTSSRRAVLGLAHAAPHDSGIK